MTTENKDPHPNELSPLIDSEHDRKEMETEITEIDLPGVEDIPGQQNIVPAPLGELSGTTISSSDEEGDDVFNDDIDKDVEEDTDSNVSETEKEDLETAANDMPGDDENLRDAALDSTDEDGTPLNEDSFDENISPDDLDVPGAKQDDADEKIGEEDEQNNEYSIAGTEEPPQDDF